MASQKEDRSRCVIIVPYVDSIEPRCEAALRALETRGYPVRRAHATAAIDRIRSELATQAIGEAFDEILWIDPDMVFEPDVVDRVRSHRLPIVGGLYAKRGHRAFGCRFLEEPTEVTLGEGGGPVEVRYVGAPFLLTHRRVYQDVAKKFDLPACNGHFGVPAVPYFLPMIVRDKDVGFWYLSEGWSFCERARQSGHKIMVDTSIRLWHVGMYSYGWEDVGTPIARAPGMKLRLKG